MRHGETSEVVKGIINDDPTRKVVLNSKGREEAKSAAEKLRKMQIEMIFTSEFPRTKQTAAIVNMFHKVPVQIDARLDERSAGFDGKLDVDYKKSMGKEFFHITPKNGESFQDEKKRLRSFIKDLKKMPYKEVLVVTHGEPLHVIKGYFDKLSDQEMYDNFLIHTCQIFSYEL